MNPEEYEDKYYTHPQAAKSKNSKGRLKEIDKDPHRTEFQRDVHRIIYSQPFRRLRHKTQVFILVNNDHVCTRLEHSIYVASASRTIARYFELNEDLAEAIGLAHDIGHAPFGHHGEDILNKLAKNHHIQENFQHEINGLRVVDKLGLLDRETEPGLNLTYEVRDGIISHCGEEYEREIKPDKREKDLDSIQKREQAGYPSTLEGCIVRMVDKIAYVGRDLEDGIKAGLIKENDIPSQIKKFLGENNGNIVGNLLNDLIKETKKEDAKKICLSEEMFSKLGELYNFNNDKIYHSERVERYKTHAETTLNSLFIQLLEDFKKSERLKKQDLLPKSDVYKTLEKFVTSIKYGDNEREDIIIFDFISGMTDNYVLYCFDEIFKPKATI